MRSNVLREITLPDLNGGLNTHDPENAISDNQSPDMLNLWYKDMALCKRPGQTMALALSGVRRVSGPYNGYRAVHAGTKLYKWDAAAGTAAKIKSGIQSRDGVFCEFGDTLYYIDGSEIWQINADYTAAAVAAYVPVVRINARPDLSGSDDGEPYNLLGAGFTVKYNGDGATKVFKLPQTGLDAAAMSVSVNAAAVSAYTADRTAGTVTFTTAPGAGTSNVWITAYKTQLESDGITPKRKRIAGCGVAVRFGGEAAGVVGGTRVFVTGNPDFPYTYWRSDLGLHAGSGMAYFPDTSEEVLDQNSEAVTAAAKMGDQLILFKENSIFAVGYAFDGADVYYPVRECHSAIGCDMPGSVQLIDNRLVFAHSKTGVHILIGADNALENIVKPLSANINALLLKESGLSTACSCDFDRYYWLRAGAHVYLWDYDTTPYYNYADYDKAQKRLAWYRFDGIGARTFFSDTSLYYGGDNGIVQFTGNKNDFDAAYSAYFKSKAFDLGHPDELKTFMYLYPSFSTDGNIKATVSAGSESTDRYMAKTYDICSFDWGEFNWGAFTWGRIKFSKTYMMRLRMKKAAYIQVTVSGGEKDRGLGLSGLRITYYTNRKVKG